MSFRHVHHNIAKNGFEVNENFAFNLTVVILLSDFFVFLESSSIYLFIPTFDL